MPLHQNSFKEFILDCGLTDLPLDGYPFTWKRKECGMIVLEERLDRALVTPSWLNMFPSPKVSNLITCTSYHYPILLSMHPKDIFWFKRKIRFGNKWLVEPDLDDAVITNWENVRSDNLICKLDNVCSGLDEWGKNLARRFKEDIAKCKKEMHDLRGRNNVMGVARYDQLGVNFGNLLAEEEAFWRQRSKVYWLKDGDVNSKFFHASATACKEKNKIKKTL